MSKILSIDDVCRMIDEFPGTAPVVAAAMKDLVRQGKCPHAIRVSLNIEPVTMYRLAAPEGESKP